MTSIFDISTPTIHFRIAHFELMEYGGLRLRERQPYRVVDQVSARIHALTELHESIEQQRAVY